MIEALEQIIHEWRAVGLKKDADAIAEALCELERRMEADLV